MKLSRRSEIAGTALLMRELAPRRCRKAESNAEAGHGDGRFDWRDVCNSSTTSRSCTLALFARALSALSF